MNYIRDIGQGGVYLSAYNEIFIAIDNNYREISFNQNWTYLGVGKKVSDHLKLQFGLKRQYIRRGGGSAYESNFNMRLDVTHTIR